MPARGAAWYSARAVATTLNSRGRRSLEEALLTLRSWSDSGDFPDLVCRSLATLLGGPAALYCIPEKGKGQRAVGAVHGFELARLFTTPFLRQGLVTDPIFKSSDENNGAWVKSNQSVMGDELADDAARWLAEWGDPYTRTGADVDGRVGIDWGVYGVPETFVIDKQGVIRFKQIGPVTPEVLRDEIIPLVRKLGA